MQYRGSVSKFHNVPTVSNGILFQSKKEADCYTELLLRKRIGEIEDLFLQMPIHVIIDGVLVFKYLADFCYVEVKSGTKFIIDVKGMRTPLYKLKKKVIEALYKFKIIER